ncbi:DUF6985 domain-containing protein [Aeoliella sp. SH292]|uniref:DUF6985 domain-containing protein n=1 Tax=Aeoliella sp. SH292 TaxID=3454464 RepID=UPI003F9776AA
MSEFASNFKREKQIPHFYEWETDRPIFQHARVRYALRADMCSRWEDTSGALYVSTLQEKPSQRHERTWEYLIDNASDLEQILKRVLLKYHLYAFRLFIRELEQLGDSTFDSPVEWAVSWSSIRDELSWEGDQAVDAFFELCAVHLLEDGDDATSDVEFGFSTSWDEEHGIQIIMRRDEIMDDGGLEYLLGGM